MSGPIDAATARFTVSGAVRAADPSSISVLTLKHLISIAHSKHENVEPALIESVKNFLALRTRTPVGLAEDKASEDAQFSNEMCIRIPLSGRPPRVANGAVQEGWTAYEDGQTLSRNPYTSGIRNAFYWTKGWYTAQVWEAILGADIKMNLYGKMPPEDDAEPVDTSSLPPIVETPKTFDPETF